MTGCRSRALLAALCLASGLVVGCAPRSDLAARPVSSRVRAPHPDRRVIILALDRVSLPMLREAEMPTLHRLTRDRPAALGLMSTRSRGDRSHPHLSMWATIGAGCPAVLGDRKPSVERSNGGLRLAGMAAVEAANRRHHTLAKPGALGEALHRAGLTTAAICIGSHDSPWSAPLVAADCRGRIDCGTLDADTWPHAFDRCAEASVIVIDFGETRRADVLARDGLASKGRAREAALRRADRLLADLTRRLRPGRDLLVVLSPTGPTHSRLSERSMAPVITLGAGNGLLTSPSTRRAGIVIAADIAPTALAWLGAVAPPEMSGRPMGVLAANDAARQVAGLDRRISATYAERFSILPILAVVENGMILLLAVWWLLRPGSARRSRLGRAGPLLGYALFAALLALPWFGVRPTGQVVAIWLGLSLIGAAVAFPLGRLAGPAAINAASAALIAADAANGGHWPGYSIMGADTIIGGRFYGLANQEAGLLVCSLALAVGFAVQRWGWRLVARVIVGLAFAVAVVLIGLPTMGANWGSAIVAVVGLGLTYALLGDWRLRRRDVAAIIGATVLVAVGLLALDRGSVSTQSHMGRAAGLVFARDLGAAWSIYARKVASNVALLGLSPWVIGFLAMIVVMIYLLIWPPPRLAAVLSRYRAVAAALVGCVVAMCVGMVVNDTGSVAGAIISVMVMQAMVYLVLLPSESDASAGG